MLFFLPSRVLQAWKGVRHVVSGSPYFLVLNSMAVLTYMYIEGCTDLTPSTARIWRQLLLSRHWNMKRNKSSILPTL
jgi:hypothetical protein